MKPLHITLSLLFIITTGCDELGVKTTPYIYDTGDTDTTAPLEDFVVTDIDPNFGSPAGGTSVVISGNGFEGDVAVSFGNMDVDITVIDDETILLETPSSPSEGQVDVTVESDLGTTTIENGFTYTNAAPEDTDTDTQDTKTHKIQEQHKVPTYGGLVENVAQGLRLSHLFYPSFSSANDRSVCFHSYASSGFLDILASATKQLCLCIKLSRSR